MPIGAPSTQKIIDAWYSVSDEWDVRLNKSHRDGKPWEVVHAWHVTEDGCVVVDDATMKVVGRFATVTEAHARADDLEDLARAGAVSAMMVAWNK